MVDPLALILSSPRFLYLVNPNVGEENVTRALDAVSLANRLAAFLWSGPPDEELMRVAMDGESKQFIGHRVVQELVDNVWRGKHFLSQAWVPSQLSTLNILLCWMRLRPIELEVPPPPSCY